MDDSVCRGFFSVTASNLVRGVSEESFQRSNSPTGGQVIESVIEHITLARSPGSGDDLLGFQIDAEEFLGRAEGWRGIRSSRTSVRRA